MSNKKIHIIDDEPAILESVGSWLSKKYEVHVFSSAKEYIQKIKIFRQEDQTNTCKMLY